MQSLFEDFGQVMVVLLILVASSAILAVSGERSHLNTRENRFKYGATWLVLLVTYILVFAGIATYNLSVDPLGVASGDIVGFAISLLVTSSAAFWALLETMNHFIEARRLGK